MSNPNDEIHEQHVIHEERSGGIGVRSILAIAAVTFACLAIYSYMRLSNQQDQSAQLARTNQTLRSSLDQVQGQLQSVTERMNSLSMQVEAEQARAQAQAQTQAVPPTSTAQSEATEPQPHHAKAVRAHRTSPKSDPRWAQLNAKLEDEDKKIESNRNDLDQAKTDLQNQLGSTRDELNGSISQSNDQIARSHEDIVALQRRGERNYYEFDLGKSKQFQRVGPVSLSIRKVNESHKYYDVALLVDDQRIEKKHVDLFEPLVINLPEHSESIQLVVNRMDKDHVKGYLSEPKYKKADMASNSKPAATGAAGQQQPPDGGAKSLQPR